MNRDDIQKLLGGYATGTLTPEEQQALFEAALDDQELFDAIAREQALRDLLRDPAAKAHLLTALDHRPPSWYERLIQGWRPVAAAVALAAASVIAVVVVRQNARPPQPVMVARVSPPPVASDTLSAPPAAANPAPQSPATRDSDAPAERLAKESRSEGAASPKGMAEEDQISKQKQRQVDRKDTGTASGLKDEAAPLPALPPTPRQMLSSGFRDAPGRSSVMPPAAQPASPSEPKAPLNGRTGNVLGGAVGGVLGGVAGGVPAAVPPPPPPPAAAAPPKVETQPAQSQLAQSGPSQAKQSQQAAFPSSQGQQGQVPTLSPLQQLRSAKEQAAPETVNVQATAAALDAISSPDVKSRFYGNFIDPHSVNAPAFRAAGADASMEAALAAEARKKAAEQTEKTPAKPQPMAVNSIRAGGVPMARQSSLGVRYSLLRKSGAGVFEPMAPESLKTGDSVALQLMPNQSGELSVHARDGNGSLREVMSRNVEPLVTYTTPQLKSGDREVQVVLTTVPSSVTNLGLRRGKSQTELSRQSTSEPATYVVSSPAFPELRFTISLNYK